jgi:hypothetical protein
MLLALALPAHDPDVRWLWIVWRRRQRELARRSHYKRRGHVAPPRTPLTAPQPQVPL